MSTGAGKGDKYRPVNKRVYDTNYDAIFRKPMKPKTKEQLEDELAALRAEFEALPRKWDSYSGWDLCSKIDALVNQIQAMD